MRFLCGLLFLITAFCAGAETHIQGLILDAETGEVLYSKEPEAPFKPASVTKLFTAYASLEGLDQTFRFKTALSYDGTALHLQFSGDPSLTQADLADVLSVTQSLAIRHTLRIPIVVHSPLFTGPKYPLGTTYDSLPMCYATPASDIMINHNCIKVTVLPNNTVQTKAPSDINIISQLEWTKKPDTCVFQPTWVDDQTLALKGCLESRPKWHLSFAHPMTLDSLKAHINQALRAKDIKWDSELSLTHAPLPRQATELYAHYSDPLPTLIKHMLLDSDNLYADTFTKILGGRYMDQASFKGGIAAIRKFTGIPGIQLEDGAGHSHYNRVTSFHVMALLQKIDKNSALRHYFLASLPESGKSGTLKHRFNEPALKGHIFAKTGSLTRHFALAGWLLIDNKRYLFVLAGESLKDKTPLIADFSKILLRQKNN